MTPSVVVSLAMAMGDFHDKMTVQSPVAMAASTLCLLIPPVSLCVAARCVSIVFLHSPLFPFPYGRRC